MNKKHLTTTLGAIALAAFLSPMAPASAESGKQLNANGCYFNPVHRVWLEGDYYCGPNASGGIFEAPDIRAAEAEKAGIQKEIQAERAKAKPSVSRLDKLNARYAKVSERHTKQVNRAKKQAVRAIKAFKAGDYAKARTLGQKAALSTKRAVKSGQRLSKIQQRIDRQN